MIEVPSVYKTLIISTIVDLFFSQFFADIVYKTLIISTIVDTALGWHTCSVYKTLIISTIVDSTEVLYRLKGL